MRWCSPKRERHSYLRAGYRIRRFSARPLRIRLRESASLPLADYIGRTAKYFPPYLGYALLYIAAGVAVVKLVRAVRASAAAA